jgi:hypothetical protein
VDQYLNGKSKLVTVDEQPDDCIVPPDRPRKANCFTSQSLNPVLLQKRSHSGLMIKPTLRASLSMQRQQPFKWRHFLPDIILLNVR